MQVRGCLVLRTREYGGILCDIGSHQIEQYLHFAGEEDAVVESARVENYANPDHPELEDYGDCMITGKNGTSFYFRVDWFTRTGFVPGGWTYFDYRHQGNH
ncbi:MAG: hypothetical protein ACLSGA_13920 [Ruminococcus sp.]